MLTRSGPLRYHPVLTTEPLRLTADEARRVARLARLAPDEAALERHRAALAEVLGYVQTLRELDLALSEPMAHPAGAPNRADSDVPHPALPREGFLRMAPESDPPYLKVPKVLGEGGA